MTGTYEFWMNNTQWMYLDFNGDFYCVGPKCYRPGGGAWDAVSDERVKRDVAQYGAGLAEVCRLRPISFRYNGKGGTRDDGRTYHGVIAQEAREVMPELVTEEPAMGADGKRLPDILDGQLGTNLGPLTLALVNAVRELADMVRDLTGRVAAMERLVT